MRRAQRSYSAVPATGPRAYASGAERYERQRMIGQGSYGKVYLVRNRETAENLVMKIVNLAGMNRADRDDALREAETLQKLSHPNIIKYVESFVSNRALHIVTEHCARGDLERMIEHRMGRRLPDEQIAQIFSQVCLGVQHLHERHILHRDLKASNIFIAADGTVRLGDFGLAKVLAHTMACAKTACGTPYYMAPEICQERPYHNRSDVWAIGCVLYKMASGRHPFEAKDLKSLFAKITRGQPDPLPGVAEDLRNLISQLLQRDPLRRPAVSHIFASPFLARFGLGVTPPAPSVTPAAGAAAPLGRLPQQDAVGRRASAAAGQQHTRDVSGLPAAGAAPPRALWEGRGDVYGVRPPPPPRPARDAASEPPAAEKPRAALPPLQQPHRPSVPPVPGYGGRYGQQYGRRPSIDPTPPPSQPRERHPARHGHHRGPPSPHSKVSKVGKVDYGAMLAQQRTELEERDRQMRNWRAARDPRHDDGPRRDADAGRGGAHRGGHGLPPLPCAVPYVPAAGKGRYEGRYEGCGGGLPPLPRPTLFARA